MWTVTYQKLEADANEVFEFDNTIIKCIPTKESDICADCYFQLNCEFGGDILPVCKAYERLDRTNVYYEELK
jgi:hypothetical protein